MQKNNQRKIEKEFQKALAIEYVKNYFIEHNLSLSKLKTNIFVLSGNEFAFEKRSGCENELCRRHCYL